jgi:hypothetical protein
VCTFWAAVLALVLAAPARADLEDLAPERNHRPPVHGVRKGAWERARGGPDLARIDLQRRLAGWPSRLHVDREELLRASDRDFLERVARDTWRGLTALVDREHGLPINHVLFLDDSLAPRGSKIGDYASTTDIGLYLISVAAARDLGFVTPDAALDRVRRTLDTMDRLEKSSGFFFNYYDTTTLERTSDFVSFVDSMWLAASLIVVRQSFPELAGRCTAMLERRDYAHFYDRRARQMIHGFFVDPPRRSPHHYGTLYTEARLGSLLAIAKGDVPRAHWDALARTEPRWLDGRPVNGAPSAPRRWPMVAGRHVPTQRTPDGYYDWKQHRYVPSWGGSMFEALMPLLVLDELSYAAASLGPNARAHVEVQRHYALDHLEYPVWGMSPSWSPDGQGYREYGVRVLGAHGYPAGAVTPHAVALALMVEPEVATEGLRELVRRFDVYGEFGFYDAVDPMTGQVVHAYLVLDQAMILVALANRLGGGVIQHAFAADPITRAMLPLLAAERFPSSAPHGSLVADHSASE